MPLYTEIDSAVNICNAALAYARLGLSVLPLEPGGKAPLGKLAPRGALTATAACGAIRHWWRSEPSANIGIALPGLLVVDVDPRNGGSIEILQGLGTFPKTWTARTGGGGWHVLFRLPKTADLRSRTNFLPGIDIKTGRSAFVVASPSLHSSGRRYEWLIGHSPGSCPLPAAPAWLLRRLAPLPMATEKFHARAAARISCQRLDHALSKINANDRTVWLQVGMALKSEFADSGKPIWDQWSAKSSKFDPKTQVRAWRSFRRNGVGIGSIFWLAKEGGGHAT